MQGEYGPDGRWNRQEGNGVVAVVVVVLAAQVELTDTLAPLHVSL